MLTIEEKKQLLDKAYIPEHVVGLMTHVSGGEPFLIDDYFCCHRGDWIILVGYPLSHEFVVSDLEDTLEKIIERFRPKYFSLMAPELPAGRNAACRERESDYFYTLKSEDVQLKGGLRRIVNKAKELLTVEQGCKMRDEHQTLSAEFIRRAKPPTRVRDLLLKMPGYVGHAEGSAVLNAWDAKGKLSAFYVVDNSAKDFTSYVIGCHSKKHYVTGASDLLCFKMIEMSRELGKRYIHLGLGVNEGIRRFKKKWGGIPSRKYEMCELVLKRPSIMDMFKAMAQ